MDIQVVITQMIVLFLLVLAGFVARKLNLTNRDFDKTLSNLVIQVTCPSLIIASTMGDVMPERRLILPLLGVSALTYLFLIGLAYVLPYVIPCRREQRGMYSFMLAFANVGFIGYPIVASIFGNSAVFYACILNSINTLTVFIWGVMFVAGGKLGRFDWKLLYSSPMIATYISILIVATGWRAPHFASQAFTLLGNMTVPSALLVIGSCMAGIPLKRMAGSKGVYVMSVFRLLLLPLSLYYLLLFIGVDHQVAAINIILAGMPVASFGTMFCLKYGKDETVMSQGTFITTLLSVISIPILAMMVQ